MTRIDQFSLTTVPIEQLFNDKVLGAATGFIWKVQSRHFLITNWHVATCKHLYTREHLTEHGGRPNFLRCYFNLRLQDFGKQEHLIRIRNETDQPLWYIHPFRRTDVAVIPLPYDGTEPVFNMYPINTLAVTKLLILISMEVFILGYPFGIEPPGFPVWKRGSVASEPDLVGLGQPYLLVDTASRPGMSGAPVIRRSWTNHLVESGVAPRDDIVATKVVGIYSGRLGTKDKEDAQLGMVWPISLVEDIVAAGKRDSDFE
jgi:Trypsin-like peptidase domain